MEKALTYYNYEAAKKLDEIDANKRWGLSETPPTPPYKKPEIKRNLKGWVSFFKEVLLNNVRQLKI